VSADRREPVPTETARFRGWRLGLPSVTSFSKTRAMFLVSPIARLDLKWAADCRKNFFWNVAAS
jgi:hypothetical protein